MKRKWWVKKCDSLKLKYFINYFCYAYFWHKNRSSRMRQKITRLISNTLNMSLTFLLPSITEYRRQAQVCGLCRHNLAETHHLRKIQYYWVSTAIQTAWNTSKQNLQRQRMERDEHVSKLNPVNLLQTVL